MHTHGKWLLLVGWLLHVNALMYVDTDDVAQNEEREHKHTSITLWKRASRVWLGSIRFEVLQAGRVG